MLEDDLMSDEDLDPPDMLETGSDDGGDGVGAAAVVAREQGQEDDDVYAYEDPNDPVDRVLDVYLSDQLEDQL